MAQIEVFHQSAIDFDNSYKFACGPIDQFPTTLTHISGLASISPPKSNGLAPVSVHSILVSEEETHGNDTTPDPDVAIPGLPPVLSGHPEVILRQLIARSLSNEDESNEEKAFFVADLSQVLKQHQRFVKCLPGIEPFYAIKCNPDPYVLRMLAAIGVGFDCASHGEISQVTALGVHPSRIIFANPCKPTSFIRNAARAGVNMMTFDNMDELYKVAKSHPKAELVVRILTDDSKSLCRLGLKFGAPLNTVPTLLEKAKELGLNVIGVSFHVGSGSYDSSAFADAVMRARLVFDMGREVGYNFSLLDVGGGFEDGNFETTASVLNHAIERFFPIRDGITIIAEPGRFYVSNAFTLAANVIARRAAAGASEAVEDVDNEERPKVMYYINDGVYGSFNCIMYDHQVVHPYVLTLGRNIAPASIPKNELQQSSVWGPTCDSIDCVCPSVHLPKGLEVGDWLGFDNMGAYTICAASQFNGFQNSAVQYTTGVGAESKMVRRALLQWQATVS